MENRVLIREFNEARDVEVVGKLEKNCDIESKNGVALFTNMMTDPLCRIRYYAVHVMLVAELQENGELVGVVRGCIKCVGTKFEGQIVKLGCILGLRVSPRHRRRGIGFHLVKSVEEWLMRNGAHYTFLATEKNNVVSTNLFTSKFNYMNFSSLFIFVQPVSSPLNGLSQDIKIEKLQIDRAISLYNNKLRSKDFFPTDIHSVLKEKLSLGTWVSYFKEEAWFDFENNKENNSEGTIIAKTSPSSWVMFSIWNSCEAYKIHISKSHHPFFKFLHATLNHAKVKIFPCIGVKMPISSSLGSPFGFLFLYGLYGEGERLGELMKSVLSFASRLAGNIDHCKVIMTELGVSDPLIQHVPRESSISCIHDLWYLKKLNCVADDNEEERNMMMKQLGNVFVDPREF